MLDLKFVLANLDQVQKAIDDKKAANEHTDLKKLVSLEETRKKVILEVEKLKAERNVISKQIGGMMGQLKAAAADPAKFSSLNSEVAQQQAKSKALGERIQQLETEQNRAEHERDEILS